ncbi:protein DBF4 homolog B [Poecile atricapillus]|uniref:protein DBF4 homolog B n=1 Tax=Poecile atricapillus TaxID=48891 RepID=UPI00273866EB|nr:protein DBF4 homolog B [Poecile atricapillus]
MAGTASPRPLRGQSFYLDLPSGRSARDLAEAIGRLGGVTESFLSKEVTCVVSSNREAKRGQARAREEKLSSPTAEGTKCSSSVPAAPKGNPARPRQKPPYTALLSRGKELLHKAMKNQDTCSGSSILANARLWGVQILHVDEMLSYAQQLLRAISGARKQCQKIEMKCPASRSKIHKGKLKPPFLKVEDQSRQFQPFHHQFQSFPDLNFLAPKSSSPFEPLKSLSNSCQARGAEGCALHSAGGKSPRSTHVTVPRKRRGFCECCQETFEELQKHLQSPQHQRFAQDNSRYIPVDRVISQLTNSFVERSAKVPWACLADERVVPQAHSTGGIKLLPAELGKEGEQPEQGAVELVMDTELDHGLKTKGCSPCLPRDRVRDPRGGGGLSKHSSLQLPRGAGPSRGVCAAHGAVGEAGLGASGLGLAPELGWGPRAVPAPVREAMASSFEPHALPGSVSPPPQAQPASRKRQLCSRQSSQVQKRPRLELGFGLSPLGEQMELVGGGMGTQGAGQVSEPGLPSVVGAGSLPLGTELSNRPHSSLALDLCLCDSPGDPVSQPGSPGAVAAGCDPGEAAAASTVSKHGWSRERSQGKQRGGDSDNTPRNGNRPGLESTASRTSCPAGCLPSPTLPVAEARCCCSLHVRAAEEAAPGAPDVPRQGTERARSPGLLPPAPQSPGAAHSFSRSSLESHWDVQLLPSLRGARGHRIPAGDGALLQQTHGSVRDSSYTAPLCSVLKESDLAWAGREDKNCRNCCTGTRGASFPIVGTLFGS